MQREDIKNKITNVKFSLCKQKDKKTSLNKNGSEKR